MDELEFAFLGDDSVKELTHYIDELSKEIRQLSQKKYMFCKHLALHILEDDVRNEEYIEHVLDNFLEILMYFEEDDVLILYRHLCEHYGKINPEAADHYMHLYKEIILDGH